MDSVHNQASVKFSFVMGPSFVVCLKIEEINIYKRLLETVINLISILLACPGWYAIK